MKQWLQVASDLVIAYKITACWPIMKLPDDHNLDEHVSICDHMAICAMKLLQNLVKSASLDATQHVTGLGGRCNGWVDARV